MRLYLSLALLAAGVLLVGAPAAAQVAVWPDTVAVTLAEGETTTVALTVSPASADSAAFALSLAPALSADDPPGAPGDLLFATERGAPITDAYDFTMTPEGRLFGAASAGRNETVELTPQLGVVRKFPHPTTTNLSGTTGIAFEADGGDSTLWWLDLQGAPPATEQAVLLEGSLDGTPTGRTISVSFAPTGRCGDETGRPARLVYESDGATEPRFYHLDVWNDTISAWDTLGQVAGGYPVATTDYAGVPSPFNPEGCLITGSLDAHALGGEAVFEVLTGYPFVHPNNRAYTVVVTDRAGHNRGAETPLFDLVPPDGVGSVLTLDGVVRSRVDPSVLYTKARTGFLGSTRIWVFAVRAAPLPPVWLHAAPILFETEGGADTTLVLSLDASGLEPGVYEAVASVREGDGIGPVLAEVPVVLTVRPTTPNEEAPAASEAFSLGEPYPNPSRGSVVVPLVLGTATEARVVVFDVLGRRVAVLHDGPVAAGTHRLVLDTAGLPAGVYVVRATTETLTTSRQITVVH